MSASKPLVSVFLLTYNQENFIGESIESVLNQNYENLEIVIGDDCSQDGTWKIVEGYQQKFPGKIKAFRNERNLGITGNSNEILKRCTGKYIAFHAGDDVFLPGKINNQVQLMQKHSDCVLCYHDIEEFESSAGRTIRFWNHGKNSNKEHTGSTKHLSKLLVTYGTAFMAAISIMARRDAIPSWGFDTRIPIASDWMMWIDICAGTDGQVLYIGEVLSRYRKHKNNITRTLSNQYDEQYMTLALVEARYPRLLKNARQSRAHYYYLDGIHKILNNKFPEGRNYLFQSFRYSFCSWKWAVWWMYSWLKQFGLLTLGLLFY